MQPSFATSSSSPSHSGVGLGGDAQGVSSSNDIHGFEGFSHQTDDRVIAEMAVHIDNLLKGFREMQHQLSQSQQAQHALEERVASLEKIVEKQKKQLRKDNEGSSKQ